MSDAQPTLSEAFGQPVVRAAETTASNAHRVLSKLRLILAGCLGLPLILLVGGAATWHCYRGRADLNVVAPAAEGVEFALDNKRHTLGPGASLRLRPRRGAHTLRVSRPALGQSPEYAFDVPNGYWDGVLVLPGQCLAQVDVTNTLYESEPEAEAPGLAVEQRFPAPGIWELELSTYLSLDKLPRSAAGRVRVLLEVPCGLLGEESEPALRAHLLRTLTAARR